MRLHIVAIGRAKPGPERDLYEQFARRLVPPPVLREVEERRQLPPDRMKLRQGELLLAALPEGARVVALDERGKGLDSATLARRLADWRDQGTGDLAFVIGGADGLSDSVRARAELVWSLGPSTWPHMLVRALVAEQLYRADSILKGHPYHRA